MDIHCTVTGQRLRITTPPRHYVRGTNDFIRFLFDFSGDWYDLLPFAQFRQFDQVSNAYITDVTVTENGAAKTYPAVTLPHWPKPGPLTMVICGTGNDTVIAMTNPVLIGIDENGFVDSAITEDLDETLYQQLVSMFNNKMRTVQNAFVPTDFITVNNLIDITAADTYKLFDAYVEGGMLTKQRIGYGTAATPATGTAAEDTNLPIYMYSYTRKVKSLTLPTPSETNKKLLFFVGMHGPEKMGVPILLTLLHEHLLGNNPRVEKFFCDYDIDIIPVVNPYGWDAAIGTTMETVNLNTGRTNARGVDINRNGKTAWDEQYAEWDADQSADKAMYYPGEASRSEKEAVIISNLFSTNNYFMFFDIHTERYNRTLHPKDMIGRGFNASIYGRDCFVRALEDISSILDEKYDIDITSDINSLIISASTQNAPQANIDFYMRNENPITSTLIEMPRWWKEAIYPTESQEISTLLTLNYIFRLTAAAEEFLPHYITERRTRRQLQAMHTDAPLSYNDYNYGFRMTSTPSDPKPAGKEDARGGYLVYSRAYMETKEPIYTIPEGTVYLRGKIEKEYGIHILRNNNGTLSATDWHYGEDGPFDFSISDASAHEGEEVYLQIRHYEFDDSEPAVKTNIQIYMPDYGIDFFPFIEFYVKPDEAESEP